MKVKWLLDSNILEKLTYGNILEAIEKTGNSYELVDYFPGNIVTEFPDYNEPVLLYGCHKFCETYGKSGKYFPGNFGVNNNTLTTNYMSHVPLDWFLNSRPIYMSWSMFKQRAKELLEQSPTKELFIRPNSGFKTFAGQIIKNSDLQDHINTLEQISSVVDETMIMISNSLREEIKGEFRFVVVDRNIISGSEYRWDQILDVRRDWPEECEKLAKKVADLEWQLDTVYTVDICLLSDDRVKIVELNSFSCAGLYACDLNLVVEAVSKQAIKEWNYE